MQLVPGESAEVDSEGGAHYLDVPHVPSRPRPPRSIKTSHEFHSARGDVPNALSLRYSDTNTHVTQHAAATHTRIGGIP
jgi:hypothetical protein